MSNNEIQSKQLMDAHIFGYDQPEFSDITLVPGGRYLFTVSPMYHDNRTYIKLWDLGRPGGAEAQVILAEYIYEHKYVCRHKIAPTADGRGIRFLVISTWQIVILEIYPESPNPKFEYVTCLDIDTDGNSEECNFKFVGIHGNQIVLSISISRLVIQPRFRYFDEYTSPGVGHIVVWDFIEEKTATIHTGKIIIGACIIKDDCVIGTRFGTNETFLWDLPEREKWKQTLFFRRNTPPTPPTSTQLLPFAGALDRIVKGVKTQELPRGWSGADQQAPQRLLSLYGTDSGIDEMIVSKFNNNETSRGAASVCAGHQEKSVACPRATYFCVARINGIR
ncbi:hypothetical protein JR316_0008736 [Psilocybe cubensis]|nr:hypothetical protein JR316_0008736 [Psilocybe cubensis]KAH9478283.1 hypothetical protein JR316_0008736 [Psilocybe cubensis]